MLNRWQGIGNLGRDVELRYTQSGKAVGNFSMAVDGGGKDKTEWVNVVVWEKIAENCAKYIGKGSLVYVEGRLQTRKWEDQGGNTRYTTEVVAWSVKFLNRREDAGQHSQQAAQTQAQAQTPAPAQAPMQAPANELSFGDDNIPF